MLSKTTHWKTALAATLCCAALSHQGLAQVAPPTILQIDTENVVLYFEDTPDPAMWATDPNVPTRVATRNFGRVLAIGDIVAVNGQSAKGTHTRGAIGNLGLNPAPNPGQAIADTARSAVAVFTFEILNSDGTPIGTIVANGLAGGAAPPGSPLTLTGGNNFVIAGGTGAFLGVRGQLGAVAAPAGVSVQRAASMTEDPANRRRNGGGSQRWIAYLIPMTRPEIIMLPAGPAITHSSDFSLVTASKPAAGGEILSIFAKGLGPVNPGVDPGQPFPSSPLAIVNSPIEVLVNGKPAEVLSSAGYPGTVDGYQVNFRLPPDAGKGSASVQVSAAWMSGAAVTIPVQ
jgi:uncharacterized protein (TIGR03437 family)